MNKSNGPLFINTGAVIDGKNTVGILESHVGYGMGTYTIVEPKGSLTLFLNPSTTLVDNINYPSSPTPYESTITYTVSSGP